VDLAAGQELVVSVLCAMSGDEVVRSMGSASTRAVVVPGSAEQLLASGVALLARRRPS
jgi:hypothetical protein